MYICVRLCVRCAYIYLHKCRNSQNTNPKKTFVTFSETFYTFCGRGSCGRSVRPHTTAEPGQWRPCVHVGIILVVVVVVSVVIMLTDDKNGEDTFNLFYFHVLVVDLKRAT